MTHRNPLRLLGACLLAATALATSVPALAQAFPSKPVRIVVPFPPGGTTDILARDLSQQLAQKWGVSVVVENKAGASGSIGSLDVVRSAPDGHTLLLTATHHVINPGLRKNLPYNTRTDFTSIALIAAVPNVLIVNASTPYRSVDDLIRAGKEKPGSLSFASTGIGGANHLAGELFKSMTGVEMTHIPYKGAAPAMTDLLGGQIPVMFDSVPTVLPHLATGKLRALGVTSRNRVALLPDVPTLDEAGIKGFEATAWFGLYGPANIAPDVLRRISTDVVDALRVPAMQEKFARIGAEPGVMPQAEFAAFVQSEVDKWGKVIERAGISAE